MKIQKFALDDAPIEYEGRPHELIMEPCEFCGYEPMSVETVEDDAEYEIFDDLKFVTLSQPTRFLLSCGHEVSEFSVTFRPVGES